MRLTPRWHSRRTETAMQTMTEIHFIVEEAPEGGLRIGTLASALAAVAAHRPARQPAAAASAPISSRRIQAATCGCASPAAAATGSKAGEACRQASIA